MDDTSSRRAPSPLAAGVIGGILGSLITIVACFALLPAAQASSVPAVSPAPAPSSAPGISLSGTEVLAPFRCPDGTQQDGLVTLTGFGYESGRQMILCKIP